MRETRERRSLIKGRFFCSPAVLLVTTLGTIGVQAAPAVAAHPYQVIPPSSLLRQHLGLAPPPIHALPSAKASPSAASRAHLFPCHEAAPDGRCGRVSVPLDRAHPSRGKIPIFFEYFRHRDPGPARRAILVTEGGPGSSITQDGFIGPFYRDLFDPLLRKRDLILLDQRGVGRSDAIDCEPLQHASDLGSPHIYRNVRACGKQLGRAARLYGSGNVALDIEAVREALGIAKLDLYGGSAAGQDVQSYAVRFPRHVRSAVLDSPFVASNFDAPGSQLDDFSTDSAHALPHVADLLCARSESCSAERANAHGNVAWLAQRVRRHPLDGTGYDAQGTPHQVHVTETFLAWTILNADDFGFTSLSEIGAAADALRAGDRVPLLRLAAESDASDGDAGDPTAFSVGDNFARFCTDNRFSWDKNAPIATRMRQWRHARDALESGRFDPFSVDGWLARPISPVGPDPCIVWPAPKRHVPPPIPHGAKFPGRVPALVLTGDLDLSLPPPDSKPLTRLWPHSDYVEIANSGHHTATNTRSDCADPIIVHFIAKLRPGDTSCARVANAVSFPGVGRFALIADDARPAAVNQGDGDHSTPADRKVATVATAAITDAFRRSFIQSEQAPGVGLRGGTFSINFGDAKATVQLASARFAKDVAVSGTADYSYESQAIDATVTVDGPGSEDGTLHVTGVWFGFGVPNTVLQIRGSLCGRQVALQVPAT